MAAGLAGGALGHTLIESNKLYQQFAVAIEESAESLASLQRQLTSLAQDAFIGFGGNVIRQQVKDNAKWYITDFVELLGEPKE
ncbi:ERV-BabFcenv provirus ancestral Env polyprotein isoform X2 [Pan troglodytes]|uniref:ERV-BabFcenv provirus ancestral Env polyprotein isoform X2 n=1 Tax=Pan troglodytes TaxID=9598 RepID=UPI0007DBB1DF